ncbi:MAG: hypothetical protein D6812_07510 [Deltaproteobacteria bacterium]|nr:MAG: hypothetical protein D6812_07510 [Deltaproteobacteria bacterium]
MRIIYEMGRLLGAEKAESGAVEIGCPHCGKSLYVPFDLTAQLWIALHAGLRKLRPEIVGNKRIHNKMIRTIRALIYRLAGAQAGEWWLRCFAGFSAENLADTRKRLEGDILLPENYAWDAVLEGLRAGE